MATYAIGDVQGCSASLMALLEAIRFDRRRDTLWFTGDLVNRGPDSLGVLRFAADLGERAVCVLGNHDLHLLAVAHGQRRLRPKDTLRGILETPDRDALLDWLRHRPLLYQDDIQRVSLIHAGLPPQWPPAEAQRHARALEADLQGPDFVAHLATIVNKTCRRWLPSGPAKARRRYTAGCLTLLRYCRADGTLGLEHKGPPGTQPQPYLPWFAVSTPGSRRARACLWPLGQSGWLSRTGPSGSGHGLCVGRSADRPMPGDRTAHQCCLPGDGAVRGRLSRRAAFGEVTEGPYAS